MLGRITKWNDRGYGFVRCADGRDYFLHISNYTEHVGVPTVGMGIEFEIGKDPRTNRTQAMNARRAGFDAGVTALAETKIETIAGIEVLRTTQEGV